MPAINTILANMTRVKNLSKTIHKSEKISLDTKSKILTDLDFDIIRLRRRYVKRFSDETTKWKKRIWH